MSERIFAFFPGQGSQKPGMGKDFFENSELAKKYFKEANEILGFDLAKICFEGPDDSLSKTEICQPAILTVSCISYALNNNYEILVAAGHSLGEYSALVAAQAIKFQDAVLLVHKRGKYMQAAVSAGQGKMLAVLGKEVSEIELAISSIKEIVEIANINSPGQVVLSGSAAGINAAKIALSPGKNIELNVSAPFHCSLMQPAADKLALDLNQVTISTPNFPIISNFTAQATTDIETIRVNLKAQVCGRVRWVECVENGIKNFNPEVGVEFGHGKVIAGLVKKINPELNISNH